MKGEVLFSEWKEIEGCEEEVVEGCEEEVEGCEEEVEGCGKGECGFCKRCWKGEERLEEMLNGKDEIAESLLET